MFAFAAHVQRLRCVEKELVALDDNFREWLPGVASGEKNAVKTGGVIFPEISAQVGRGRESDAQFSRSG